MLGRYYDMIFPTNEQQLAFLKALLPERGSVLDVGCATGTYAIPLARLGYDVCAFDFDGAMVEMLVSKTENDENPPKALVFDMRRLPELSVGPFDLIFCIGNTLVHLETLAEVEEVVKACGEKLKRGGALVIQTVNYDRVLAHKDLSLPLIDRQEGRMRFHRYYELQDSKVIFHGQLEIEGQGKTEATTMLLPVKAEALIRVLEEAGFGDVRIYGGFDGSPHTLESPATVIVAGY
jgi:2-polyprenyl-3-methyl-5-hydroxy-6-metoxy-1,4-benzoquinol methylase